MGPVLVGLLILAGWSVAGGQSPGAEEAVTAVQAEKLLPLRERTRPFRVIDGEQLDERLPLALRPTRGGEPGEWVLEFSDLNTLYLAVAADNAVEIVRLDLPEEDLAVVYEPPVRLLPAELRPQGQQEERSEVRVYGLESGEHEHTGEVRHKLHPPSRSRFRTDRGSMAGYLVRIEQQIDLPMTQVRLDLAAGYVSEFGMVYRRVDYTRETAGLFGETLRRAAVLAEEAE
ncbi:MAG: hypothetical protein ACOCTI_06695 [Phycisphaeraceae bacterium]